MLERYFPTKIPLHEYAAMWLAHEQHADGVTVRLRNFKTEYVRPDGSIVPGFEYYYNRVKNGDRMPINK